jgi:shikimate kinase
MMESRTRPIALIGLMGAGKSAVAVELAERLGAAVADLDAILEAERGVSIAELFEREGEPAFRRHEGDVLRRALDSGARVLACGGGVVLDPDNRARLAERCDVVWLEVTPEEAARRVLAEPASRRPLLDGGAPRERLAALLQSRAGLYRDVAGVRVETDGKAPGEVAEAVLAALHQKRT